MSNINSPPHYDKIFFVYRIVQLYYRFISLGSFNFVFTMFYKVINILLSIFISVSCFQKNEVKTECPKVKAIQNFDLQQVIK